MRTHLLTLLLSLMLGGLPMEDTSSDMFNDAGEDDGASAEQQVQRGRRGQVLTALGARSWTSELANLLGDRALCIERLEIEPAHDRTPSDPLPGGDLPHPVIWTMYRDAQPVTAAGVWPVDPRVARLAVEHGRSGHIRDGDIQSVMSTALRFCRDNGYLKLQLNDVPEIELLHELMETHGFLFSRRRALDDTMVSEFYRNLYWREPHHADRQPA